MSGGKSLIDSYVQQILQCGEDDDWFEIVSDVLSDHLQAPASNIEAFNLYLFAQKGIEVKRKVIDIVKRKFSAMNGEKSESISLQWQIFIQLRWSFLYRRQCLFACNELIREEIQIICEEPDFSEPLIPQLRAWLTGKLFPFMDKTLFLEQQIRNPTQYHSELDVFAIHSFVTTRAKSLFEIILDFPDSLPAVKELRECVQQTSTLLSTVAELLREILYRRLLHLGASTNQILDFYIAMIKVLRIIDASDVLLHFVAAPVRSYLKSRPDSIRCIISSLTEAKDSELHGELKMGTSLAYGIDEDDEEVILSSGALNDWTPATRMRVLAESELLQSQSRGLDILATLVSIYGSTELFIAEYRSLLAEKLLDNATYVTDTELVNVELMKIRFGEDSLHHCEVMLRDVEDAKRTNVAIVNRAKEVKEVKLPVTDMLMVSEHYWPVRDADRQVHDTQILHPSLQLLIEDYNRRYHELKKPRVLTPWLSQGKVDLTLDFDDGASRSFKTTLFQANLIHFLSEESSASTSSSTSSCSSRASSMKQKVSAQRLSELTEVELPDVSLAMRYWVNKGVVRIVNKHHSNKNNHGNENGAKMNVEGLRQGEEDNEEEKEKEENSVFYELIEEQLARMKQDALRHTSENDENDEEESGGGGAGSSSSSAAAGGQGSGKGSGAQNEARNQAARDYSEQFVRGLLRAHGAMPLDRLQTMLTMMLRAAHENGGMQMNKFSLTMTDFAFVANRVLFMQYLQGLMDRGVIDMDSGMYCERK